MSDDLRDLLGGQLDRLAALATFACPTWDGSGRCICGAELPPQRDWIDAGDAWQRVQCTTCGRGYVDEDEYIAVYDEGLGDSAVDDVEDLFDFPARSATVPVRGAGRWL